VAPRSNIAANPNQSVYGLFDSACYRANGYYQYGTGGGNQWPGRDYPITPGDTVMIAIDNQAADANDRRVWFGHNGVWFDGTPGDVTAGFRLRTDDAQPGFLLENNGALTVRLAESQQAYPLPTNFAALQDDPAPSAQRPAIPYPGGGYRHQVGSTGPLVWVRLDDPLTLHGHSTRQLKWYTSGSTSYNPSFGAPPIHTQALSAAFGRYHTMYWSDDDGQDLWPELAGARGFSVEAVVRPISGTQVYSTAKQTIFTAMPQAGSFQGFDLRWDGTVEAFKFRMKQYVDGPARPEPWSDEWCWGGLSYAHPPDQSYVVTATLDLTTGKARLYVNGVLDAQMDIDPDAVGNVLRGYVSGRSDGLGVSLHAGTFRDEFGGRISELATWDRALSEAEVLANHGAITFFDGASWPRIEGWNPQVNVEGDPPRLTYTNANKTVQSNVTSPTLRAWASVPVVAGKVYFEVEIHNDRAYVGVGTFDSLADAPTSILGATSDTASLIDDGRTYVNGTASPSSQSVLSFGEGDVVMVALDMTHGAGANKVYWGVNGVWWTGSDPATGTAPQVTDAAAELYAAVSLVNAGRVSLRASAAEQEYPAPAGYSDYWGGTGGSAGAGSPPTVGGTPTTATQSGGFSNTANATDDWSMIRETGTPSATTEVQSGTGATVASADHTHQHTDQDTDTVYQPAPHTHEVAGDTQAELVGDPVDNRPHAAALNFIIRVA
jgi:hypothetical protein